MQRRFLGSPGNLRDTPTLTTFGFVFSVLRTNCAARLPLIKSQTKPTSNFFKEPD
jgi:hypothetical protein